VVVVRRVGRLHVGTSGANLVVELPSVCQALSDAPWNGGLANVRYVVNHRVPEDFNCGSPIKEMLSALSHLGIPPEEALGLMTAADVTRFSVKMRRMQGVSVISLATVGLTNTRGVMEPPPRANTCSTVNLIVFCDCRATQPAMVNALQTAVEAKCSLFRLLDVRSSTSGVPAAGTSTDTTTVIFSGVGRRLEYGGTATVLGYLVGLTVTECLLEQLRTSKFIGRSVLERLRERGVSVDDLVEAAVGGIVGSKPDSFEQRFLAELRAALNDPNVASLIIAALRLEDEAEFDMIPSLPKKLHDADPVQVTADEDIGEMIARYLAGTMGIHNFHHYDRLKPGCLGRLPMFLDDALCGLIGGVASKVFSGIGRAK
jgi:Uncharacterized conserved protein